MEKAGESQMKSEEAGKCMESVCGLKEGIYTKGDRCECGHLPGATFQCSDLERVRRNGVKKKIRGKAEQSQSKLFSVSLAAKSTVRGH